MNIEQVIASIRDVEDFPKPGILFKDITTSSQGDLKESAT
jgi:adenine/guanine phosphoribosyltransferase-like PRPP-binding protein